MQTKVKSAKFPYIKGIFKDKSPRNRDKTHINGASNLFFPHRKEQIGDKRFIFAPQN